MIEVAPLAFMRGRTLANAVVILDEAQNTTSMQMKMFLTRLGENSRMIVTGDPSQIDLPPGQVSGLVEAVGLLAGVAGIAQVRFTAADVVRHPLVGADRRGLRRRRPRTNRRRDLTPGATTTRHGRSPSTLRVEAGAWPPAAELRRIAERALDAAAGCDSARDRARRAKSRVVFTDDAHVRDLNNAAYRGKDAATNVLSFPAAGAGRRGALGPMLGDIVLACETVAKRSQRPRA